MPAMRICRPTSIGSSRAIMNIISGSAALLSSASRAIMPPIWWITFRSATGSTAPAIFAKVFSPSTTRRFPSRSTGWGSPAARSSPPWCGDTSTKDPVTGQTRQISNTRDHTIQIAYLEDIRSLNSSLEFDAGRVPYGRDYYRINQVTHLQLSTPYFGFQWDYKPE